MPDDLVDASSKAATHQQQAEPPTPEGGDVEEEYVVERILGQRESNNQIYYHIKWQGYPDEDNTWEPEGNLLDCPELLQAFKATYNNEARQAEPEPGPNPPVAAVVQQGDISPHTTTSKAARLRNGDGANKSLNIGFERGFKPDRILGALYSDGELSFLMKWKGGNFSDIVPAKEANERCPQLVIEYYETQIKWNKKRTIEEMFSVKDDTDDDEEGENKENSETSENHANPGNDEGNRGHGGELIIGEVGKNNSINS